MCVFGLKKRLFSANIDKESPKCTEGMNVVNRASTFIYAAFSDMNDHTISNAYHSLYIIQLCFLIQILSLNHIWGDNFAPPKFQLLKCQPRFEKSTPIPISKLADIHSEHYTSRSGALAVGCSYILSSNMSFLLWISFATPLKFMTETLIIFLVHYHCIMASEGMMCLFSQGQSTQTLTNHFRLREEGSGRRIFFLTTFWVALLL